ncbi:hypothetical protein [Marinicella sp. W31]|uniref:hypothetical protein n=1 Tax=Marinicella sp. W31 TaxID=3023713 RepID=UPI00375819E9
MNNLKKHLLLITMLIHALTLNVSAAIIVVDNAGDSGELENNCSLRDAILSASINISVDGCIPGEAGVTDVIIIQVPGPIQLNSAIPVFDSVTIATNLGAPAVSILAGDNSRIFRVSAPTNVELNFSMSNLKLMGGDAEDAGGGAVYFFRNGGSFGNIEIRNSTFENNKGSSGGAIGLDETNAISILIEDNQFINNSSENVGGAITSSRGSRGNPSGAEINMVGNLFQDNQTSGRGGAVFIDNQGSFSANIDLNNFINNSALLGGGALSLAGFGLKPDVLYFLDRNLFMHNTSNQVGGALELFLGARVFIDYSFFAFNQAADKGGAIYAFRSNSAVDSHLALSHNTIIHNTANIGDNLAITGSTFKADENIIAYPSNGDNCSGVASTAAFIPSRNLLDDESCELMDNQLLGIIAAPGLSGFTDDPMYYPGFYPTVNSPALDGGSNASGSADLNGNPIPTDGNGNGSFIPDLGAFEAPANTDLIWKDSFGQ